jgi:hypothetical protein
MELRFSRDSGVHNSPSRQALLTSAQRLLSRLLTYHTAWCTAIPLLRTSLMSDRALVT